MNEAYPNVGWCEKLGGNNLRFTFGEKLTEKDAEQAIVLWKEAFQKKKNDKVNLIWDCTNMKAYESGARKKWTNALFELKPQIGTIWLISESPLIRMGASVMGMATSLNIRTLGATEDIK